MLDLERHAKQWVVTQVYLTDRQIVGSTPIRVEEMQLAFRQHGYPAEVRMLFSSPAATAGGANSLERPGGISTFLPSDAVCGLLALNAFKITATSMISCNRAP